MDRSTGRPTYGFGPLYFTLGLLTCLTLIVGGALAWDRRMATSLPVSAHSERSSDSVLVVEVTREIPVTTTPTLTPTLAPYWLTATAMPSPTRAPIRPTPTPTMPFRPWSDTNA